MKRIFSRPPTWRSVLVTVIWALLMVLFAVMMWLIFFTPSAAAQERRWPWLLSMWQAPHIEAPRVIMPAIIMPHITPARITWNGRLIPPRLSPGGIRPGYLDPGGLRGIRPRGLSLPALEPLWPHHDSLRIEPIRPISPLGPCCGRQKEKERAGAGARGSRHGPALRGCAPPGRPLRALGRRRIRTPEFQNPKVPASAEGVSSWCPA
jgi:hypothetical protein